MKNKAPSITVVVSVKNEAKNIVRCLKSLGPARRVVVIDSNSTDETVSLAKAGGAEVMQFAYSGGYPKKRQWALNTLNFSTDWVLLLDADEVVPDALWQEISEKLTGTSPYCGYLITKGFHFLGRKFRFGGFSHSAVALFRPGTAAFEELNNAGETPLDMEVHERVIVNGPIGRLQTPLIHEDFKGLSAYIERHNHYSSWEAGVRYCYLKSGHYGNSTIRPRLFGNVQERRRFLKNLAVRVPCEPWWWFLYHYVVRLGFLEWRPGLIASQIRAHYISQVRAKLYELKLRQRYKTPAGQ
ncbi:MAG: glycosyltransferase family 2 protein [Sulfuricaulis sp.]|uniref:glycosyltransferase family 2 protein n=1 Tax=Sulfuricaulis sp. TaxID=2003553 RepID=UPI0034A28C42